MSKLGIIKDLRAVYKNRESEKVKFELPTGEIEFEIKKYIPYKEKRVIIESVIEAGYDVDVKTVIQKLDESTMDVVREYLIVKSYTDIPLSDDILEMYDLITYSGLKDFVISKISEKELDEIDTGILYGIGEFNEIRKLSNSLGHKIEGIVEMINGDLSTTLDEFRNVNINDIVAKQKLIEKQNQKLEVVKK